MMLNNAIFTLPFPVAGYSNYVDLPIVANPAIIGLVLNAQGVAITPGVNALGLLSSNGLELTIGEF